MTYLLYCIFRSERDRRNKPVRGVGAQPVFAVSNDGLSAAVSRVLPADLTPDVSRLLAYGNVVETLHADLTVIPLRYGCLLAEERQILRLLGERREEWNTLLRELDGCVEMGIRALPANGEFKARNPKMRDSYVSPDAAGTPSPGRAYLAAKKARYVEEERIANEDIALLQRCRDALAGLSVKSKMETQSLCALHPKLHAPFSSLYFLIRRDKVPSFRRAFREISPVESARLLLSGPWPPYNFVETTTAGEAFHLAARGVSK
jgi:hypothetical protein